MKLNTVIEVISTFGFIVLVFDDWRLRRRLHVDRLAREAEEALGPPHIGDIVMPDPSDPRWKPADVQFNSMLHGGAITRRVLSLGEIHVTDGALVYIGDGPPLDNSGTYGKRVLCAYKQRLVDQARGLA